MAQATYTLNSGTTAVAGLTAGTYVAALLDGEQGRGRNFIPEGAYGGSTAISTVFPTVVAAWQGSDQNNPTSGGGVTLQLQFPAGFSLGTSPTVLFLDEEALVVTAGSTGTATV